ncbi:rhamnosyltransferase [Buttiauxella selenatireducens]|uniref:Rhamnosyltransferase n=1 Tax=Buttiauxella selenatireducens TaxID=3073902 RepID=A0ABY9SGB5_9ENTR|nr:rhamnosyltransferase [Buttiauxella sp. R73]WMY75885.1 rhamnosyltransferase [Buttiauxella sp. R73]
MIFIWKIRELNLSMKNPSNNLCAIIVTYNPSVEHVIGLASNLREQNSDVLIVDNSPSINELLANHNVFNYIWLGGNKGIAAAQNVGIKKCLDEHYEYLIFFDQDSKISSHFISSLSNPMIDNQYQVCAPVFFDETRGFEYAITDIRKNGKRVKLYSKNSTEPFTSSVVISSGTLVRKDVFNTVGLMDEGLFIDYVDTEWCLRCFDKGILVYIIPQAKMLHSIGDRSFDIFGFCVPVHSAVRRYYRVRNSIHLLKYPHVPKLLAAREIVFSFIHSMILVIKQPDKKSYLKSFLTALIDGVRGVRGENPRTHR